MTRPGFEPGPPRWEAGSMSLFNSHLQKLIVPGLVIKLPSLSAPTLTFYFSARPDISVCYKRTQFNLSNIHYTTLLRKD
jgi:hypothetical protein